MDKYQTFENLFHSSNRRRDKFYSRIFGIFSENIVSIWCNDPRSSYKNLGRPTIYINEEKKHFTLDFTFQSRQDNRIYIGEMKCELEFQGYKFLTLDTATHITRHKAKRAFQLFLELAEFPASKPVKITGQFKTIHGAILVWGRFSQAGYTIATEQFKLHDVLSVENIIADLVKWENDEYLGIENK